MDKVSKTVEIIHIMRKVMIKMKHSMRNHFKEMNLTGTQGMLMGTLTHHGEMKISDLSEILGLSNSTVSGILDRLEKQGFVERVRSKEDRRVIYIKVTKEFMKHSKRNLEEVNKLLGDMMNKATPEELDIILKGMNTLEEVIERQE